MSPERAPHPAPRPGRRTHVARAARTVSLGGASLLLATGAHLAGGGRLPSVGVLAVVAFLVGLIAVTLTARRLRLGALVAALGIEQAVLHVVFDAASMTGPGCAPTPLGGHAATMAGCLGAAPVAAAPVVSALSAGRLMLVAHLVATLASAWLLARGERWWWRQWDRAVEAATWTAAPRVRRRRPARPLMVRVLLGAEPVPTAAPRGPPRLGWFG